MRQQVNLHHAFVTPPVRLPATLIFAVAGTLLIVLLGAGIYLEWTASSIQAEREQREQALEQMNAEIREMDTQLAAREPSRALQSQIERNKRLLAFRRQQLAALSGGETGDRQGYSRVLTALARQHVDGLWLTDIALRRGQRHVSIDGRSLSGALVPAWLAELRSEPALSGRQFRSFAIIDEPDDTTPGLAFSISSPCPDCQDETTGERR